MTRRAHQKAAGAAVVVGLLALGLTGCGASDQDNAALSARQLDTLEQEFPDLARSMGAKTIDTLRESTCNLNANSYDQARRTKVDARTTVLVEDQATADAVGASIRDQAEHQGWQTLPEDEWASGGGRVVYQGRRPDLDLTLTAYIVEHSGQLSVTLAANAQCMDMPEGHLMTASRLDQGVGTGYRREVPPYHAVPDAQPGSKPLPASTQTPAPTGPPGVTAKQPRDPSAPTPTPTSTKGFLDDALGRP